MMILIPTLFFVWWTDSPTDSADNKVIDIVDNILLLVTLFVDVLQM